MGWQKVGGGLRVPIQYKKTMRQKRVEQWRLVPECSECDNNLRDSPDVNIIVSFKDKEHIQAWAEHCITHKSRTFLTKQNYKYH